VTWLVVTSKTTCHLSVNSAIKSTVGAIADLMIMPVLLEVTTIQFTSLSVQFVTPGSDWFTERTLTKLGKSTKQAAYAEKKKRRSKLETLRKLQKSRNAKQKSVIIS